MADHQPCIAYYFSFSSGFTTETGRIIAFLVDQFRVFGVLSVLSLFANAIV